MKKSQKGFTLVELIVVIAIIGVLAAILVPSMMGYVKKSRLKTANSNAKLVFTTVNNQAADLIVEGKTADVLGLSTGKEVASMSGSSNALEVAVYKALKDNGDAAGFACWSIDANKNVTLAQWCSESTLSAAALPGQYPNPVNDPDSMPGSMAWGTAF